MFHHIYQWLDMAKQRLLKKDDSILTLAVSWQHELPLMDVPSAQKRLSEWLNSADFIQLNPHQQYMALEPVAYWLDALTQNLHQQILATSLPLSEKIHARYQLIATLQQQLCQSYLQQARLALSQALEPFDGTRAMQRAMSHLEAQFLTAYLIYSPVPPDLWQILHTLFALAESHQLDETELDLQENPAYQSINTRYKKILLLSQAQPFQLELTEILTLNKILPNLSVYCSLSKDPSDAEATYTVDLRQDQPPARFQHTQPPSTSVRFFVTYPLLPLLESQLTPARNLNPDFSGLSQLPLRLVRKLIHCWHPLQIRKSSRAPHDGQTALILGINSIYTALQPKSVTPKPAPALSIPAWDLLPQEKPELTPLSLGPKRHQEADIWARVYAGIPLPPLETQKIPTTPSQYWRICDQGMGGVRLFWSHANACAARVGELVALRHPLHPPTQFNLIGIVRWMRNFEQPYFAERGVEIGVETIAIQAIPIECTPIKTLPTTAKMQHALMLTTHRHHGVSLVTSSSNYQPKSQVEIRPTGGKKVLEITHAHNETGFLTQYHYHHCELMTMAKNTPQCNKIHHPDHS